MYERKLNNTNMFFNENSRLLNFRHALDRDILWAGETPVTLIGYDDVDIGILETKNRPQRMRLYDVGFCPNFAANLISLRQLQKLD